MNTGIDPPCAFIAEFTRQHGTSPTNGQIAVRFGVNSNAVTKLVRERAAAGLLSVHKTKDFRGRAIAVHAVGVVS